MAEKTRATLIAEATAALASGGTATISAAVLREALLDLVDSALLVLSDAGIKPLGLSDPEANRFIYWNDTASLLAWTAEIAVDASTGFLGLGTTSPGARLTLSGSTFPQTHIRAHWTGVTQAAGGGGILLQHNNASGGLPSSGDRLGYFFFGTLDGSTARNGGGIAGYADGAWSPSSLPTRFVVETAPSGSNVRQERLRIDSSGNIQMGGANTVIDSSRHFRLRSYTIGTLPSASTAAGQMIYCSDLGGGGGQLNSDGTNWRRVSRGGQQTVTTDAAFTLTTLTSAEEQKHTGTLTANRLVTLSTTNAYAGSRFRVTRTGGGAFNLDIGGLKNLIQNTWAEVVYDGSAWYLAAYGAL